MVAKPTGDDTGLLVAMGLILVAGITYIAVSVRAIDRRQPAAATTTL